MRDSNSNISDDRYNIMAEILENENVTQRDFSKKLGVSVSTVNVLINKMIAEGLIKMNKVSQKQVCYMLTSFGLVEKAEKTVIYLKKHYRVIYETKEKIKYVLDELYQKHDIIFILLSQDEMDEIIGIAVEEFKVNHDKSNIKIIERKSKLENIDCKTSVLLHMNMDKEITKEYEYILGLEIINLAERL